MALDDLLRELRATAEAPFEEARAAPPGVYTSEAFLAEERRALFAGEWICAGRVDALPKRGDYLTMEIAGQPVFVLRDGEGALRAFSNVCLHRMSVLLEGRGNRKFIACPYHAWTYGLDGRLRNAPWMEASPAFRKAEYRLPELRCETWDGWVYVTLNDAIEPVARRLAPVKEIVTGRYRFEDYRETFREEHVWNTNWKVLAENFMESYHLFQLHAGTIGDQSRVEEMEMPPGGDVFNYHWITKKSAFALANAHPDNAHLEGEWRRTSALITIYPGHMITLTPGYFWYLVLQPLGVDRVSIVYGGGMAPEFVDDPEGAEHVARAKAILDAVNAEDRVGTEAVFSRHEGGPRPARPSELSGAPQFRILPVSGAPHRRRLGLPAAAAPRR